MAELVRGTERRVGAAADLGRRPVVLAVAFASGVAALVYELVFFRALGLVFGVSIHAAAAVVTSFLGGLGFGAWVGGRLLARAPAWRAYGAVELLIAVFGIASPFLFRGLAGVVPRLLGDTPATAPSSIAITMCAAFLLLSWPTALMGATFPLLCRLIAAGRTDVARAVGHVYGANTLGAAAGALLAAAVTLPLLGLLGSSHLAAGLNVSLAVVAFRRHGREHGASATARGPAERPAAAPSLPGASGSTLPWMLCLTVAALVGAAALALQILGTRLLISLLGGSVHAFASVLFVFLLGVALGGATLAGWVAERTRPLQALAAACIVFAGATAAGIALLQWKLAAGDVLRGARNLDLPPDTTILGFAWVAVQLAALALLPATVASGAIFPALSRWFGAHAAPAELSRRLGALYAANAAGSIAGAIAAGFVLLPALGLRGGLVLTAATAAFAGLLAWIASRRAGERGSAWLVPSLLLAAVAAGMAGFRPGTAPGSEYDVETIWYRESAASAVKVEEHAAAGEKRPVRTLRVNGKVVASTLFIDRRLQSILGFIPTLMHRDPQRILSIALGTGMSSAALAMSGAEVTIVEISPAVVAACPLFDAWNASVDRMSNVTMVVDDGRSYLARARGTYDVISADPMHPWVSGSAYLFTREYYELARSRLAPGGSMSQWIPLYQLTTEDIAGIAATFHSVFPHVSAWLTGYDMVLIGTMEPQELNALDVQRRMQREPVRGALRDVAVYQVQDLLGCWMGGNATIERIAERAPAPITDMRPWIEFTAPRSVYRGYATGIMELLADSGEMAPLDTGTPADLRERIQRANEELRAGARRFVDTARTGDYSSARDAYSTLIRQGFR